MPASPLIVARREARSAHHWSSWSARRPVGTQRWGAQRSCVARKAEQSYLGQLEDKSRLRDADARRASFAW